MDRNLALTLIFMVCILGPCAVFAASAYASINSLGRNPSAASKIFTAMIIALVFAEACSFIAMVVVFQLFGG
ncbi:MAG TPA: ATP synthase F0 subunit C [Candidatus Omnitrophota bacterium]|nr:ATP synthase F0 subunit C [Candidatus Omnitrophota bacterium]